MSNLIDREDATKMIQDNSHLFADDDTMHAILWKILSLPLQQQWIPVSERLPEPWMYLGVENWEVEKVYYDWQTWEYDGLTYKVTYWQSLPLPPNN